MLSPALGLGRATGHALGFLEEAALEMNLGTWAGTFRWTERGVASQTEDTVGARSQHGAFGELQVAQEAGRSGSKGGGNGRQSLCPRGLGPEFIPSPPPRSAQPG